MERVLMVRGGGSEVITIFSWWIWNSTWRVARHPISLEVSVYGMIVFGRVRMARTAPIVATHCYVVVEHLYWLGWMTSGLKTRIKIVRSEWVVSAAGIQTHHGSVCSHDRGVGLHTVQVAYLCQSRYGVGPLDQKKNCKKITPKKHGKTQELGDSGKHLPKQLITHFISFISFNL